MDSTSSFSETGSATSPLHLPNTAEALDEGIDDDDLLVSAQSAPRPIAASAEFQQENVIDAADNYLAINFRELWLYRELLFFLTWRDIKIRYKQTALGALWAILQPFLTMVVFTLIFGRLGKLDSQTGGVPYAIWVFAALLPWMFFANAITNSSNSLVGSSNLITKVYFPRVIIPLATVGSGVVDFFMGALVLGGMMLYYQVFPTWSIVLLPVLLLGMVLVATGVGMMLSALTVAYRDFRYAVPFMVQIWLFITPVIYGSKMVPEKWRWLIMLNPMTSIVESFRAVFLGTAIDWTHLGVAFLMAVVIFPAGAAYFRRMERRFADII
jgi:lipopolysaccharide transport system permease protein